MDHRPFKDWLLSEEPLTTDQKHQLQAHLRDCSACTTLAEVDLALRLARPAAPAEGFTVRFQTRLAAQKKALRRRTLLGFLLLSVGVLGTVLWFTWPFLQVFVDSPTQTLSAWFSSLVNWWISFQAYRGTASTFLRVLADLVPFYVWMILGVMAVGGSLTWVASLWKFTKLPQGV